MSEEESGGSVFGGLSEAAGAAWDAASNVASAGYNAASSVVSGVETVADQTVSAGAQLMSDPVTRDEWDKAATDRMHEADSSWDQAGQDLSNAYTDIVGE
jgi:uncharacterized membrane-anchored protein YjiN (DUF445 family)